MNYDRWDEMTDEERRVYGYNTISNTNPINRNSDEFASRTFANIINSEYQDYRQRFEPYEQKVLNLAESRQLLDEQLSRITTNINNNFSNPGMNAGDLQMQRYGLSQNAQQQSNSYRMNDMSKALSTANARNNTRVSDGDRRDSMITGSNTVRNDVVRQTNQG